MVLITRQEASERQQTQQRKKTKTLLVNYVASVLNRHGNSPFRWFRGPKSSPLAGARSHPPVRRQEFGFKEAGGGSREGGASSRSRLDRSAPRISQKGSRSAFAAARLICSRANASGTTTAQLTGQRSCSAATCKSARLQTRERCQPQTDPDGGGGSPRSVSLAPPTSCAWVPR